MPDIASSDDEFDRFAQPSEALSRWQKRAIKKFGFGRCPRCERSFIRKRRDQKFCCATCRRDEHDQWMLSSKTRFVARRERQARLDKPISRSRGPLSAEAKAARTAAMRKKRWAAALALSRTTSRNVTDDDF